MELVLVPALVQEPALELGKDLAVVQDAEQDMEQV